METHAMMIRLTGKLAAENNSFGLPRFKSHECALLQTGTTFGSLALCREYHGNPLVGAHSV